MEETLEDYKEDMDVDEDKEANSSDLDNRIKPFLSNKLDEGISGVKGTVSRDVV
jgi:hypothetical protein